MERKFCKRKKKNEARREKATKDETIKRKYLCEKCGKWVINIRNHLLVHSEKRSYLCQICSKLFKKTSNLNKHLRIHLDAKRFRCKICNKSFQHQCEFYNNCWIHIKEKIFHCEICNKLYALKQKVKIDFEGHLKVHL